MLAIFPRFQRSLIYQPKRAKVGAADALLTPGRIHDVALRTDDGLTLQGWQVLPRGRAATSKAGCDRELAMGRPVVLYFPGNGGHRLFRRDEFDLLTALGVDLFAFDYRGYAENPGRPGEEEIARDALSAWKYVTEVREVAPDRIILYGESLGGAIAMRLAAHCCQRGQQPRGLIVRSTFTTLADVGAHWFPYLPVRWFVMEKYPSIDRITQVTCPLLQLHGARDTVIPHQLGESLFALAPARSVTGIAKQFVLLPHATHNDVIFADRQQIHDTILAFFDRIARGGDSVIPRPHMLNVGSPAPRG